MRASCPGHSALMFFLKFKLVRATASAYQLHGIDYYHSKMCCWSKLNCVYVYGAVVQWAVGLQMNRTEILFFKKAIFLKYFAVVEQFVLQFVKMNKVNIKHTLATVDFFKFLYGQILHSFRAFQLEIPFEFLHKHKQVRESSCSPTYRTPALRTLGMKHFVRKF